MNVLIIPNNNNTTSWSFRLSSWINPYHDLEMRIKGIAAKNLLTADQRTDLKQAFKLAYGWTWPAGRMKRLLAEVPSNQIEALIHDLLKNGDEKQIAKHIHRYLSFLDRSSLLECSGLATAEDAARWFHSRGLVKNEALKSGFEKEGKKIFKEFGIEMKYFFHHFLEVLIALLGINDIGEKKPTRFSNEERLDEYKAIHKLESYGKLIGYPALLFGFIYTYVQFKAVAVSLTTVAFFAFLVSLVAYQRYGKPCPKEHSGLRNLSLERLRSDEMTYARQDILREIERAFKEKKGVILVGEPGAGKSSIPDALDDQIAQGKICTFIPQPQIFTCGSSRFKGDNRDSVTFDSIIDRFKNYSGQTIFFLDEFHALFKIEGAHGVSKAEDLKMFCEEFKYVIGATTTKEFNQFVKNQTAIIDRRFVVIHVGAMIHKKVKIILSQYLQTKYPAIAIDGNALDYLIQKAKVFNPNTSKIDAAQTLLNRVIKEIDAIAFKELELRIDDLEEEKNLLNQDLQHAKVGKDEKLAAAYKTKQAEIDQLKMDLKKKNQQVERMKKIEAFYLELKKKSFYMADPTIALKPNSWLEKEWINLQAKIKAVGDFIEKERMELGLPTKLDKALIDRIIQEKNKK